MTRAPSATTSGVPPSAAMEDTSCLTCSGNAPPRPRTNASTMSVAPFRTCRPLSKSRPDIRVRAVNGTNFALSSRSSRARRLYFCFASTTMERPSGVSSASEESCASSASSASGTPGAGTSFTASRLPSVIVPVLSRRRTFTSPAASTARPDIARMLCLRTRSMPAMPMAERRPPIVVGMRQTRSAMWTVTETVPPEKTANGRSVTVAKRKTMVRPARRMSSAISFGVFWRSAPSTRRIIRSRKVCPCSDVIWTTMRSESTVVPPVTAERSPPASRMTGADSPVIADSFTDAIPSTTVPSPGIISFAATTTRSSFLSWVDGTRSSRCAFPPPTSRRATVSVRARRRASACALPRPSATPPAKFGKKSGAHQEMRQDGAQRKGGEEREGADDQDHADEEHDEDRPVHGKGSDGLRHFLLRRKRSRDAQQGDDHQEAAEEHREAQGHVVEVRVRVQPGEGATVVPRGAREGVEDLGEPVRPRVVQAGQARLRGGSERGSHQDREGQDEHREHRELHFLGLDLLAEVLGRPPDHEAGDEDRKDDEEEHAV